MDIEDYIGLRYGRLVIISWESKRGYQHYFKCKCDCGTIKSIRLSRLKSGETKSCGCIRKELFEETRKDLTIHGKANTRLHTIYRSMKARCYQVKHKNYSYYGGKGIEICDEWLEDFMNFYNWAHNNGYKDNLTIDRIDVKGNYEPNNCRWTTTKEQANNTSRNIYITYQGETKTLKQWSEHLGINYYTLKSRYKYGWDVEDMLTKPIQNRSK